MMSSGLVLGDALVFDDVLPPSQHDDCWRWFESQRFSFVNSVDFRKVFQIHDGRPMIGQSFDYIRKGASTTGGGGDLLSEKVAIRAVFEALEHRASEIDHFLGQPWEKITAVTYAYPTGTALSWHTDGKSLGSVLYYVHPRWGAHWGGELLIASGIRSRQPPPALKIAVSDTEELDYRPVFDQEHDDRCLLADGHGIYISPRPNRCVILKSGIPHMIKRVEPAAGAAPRCALAGMFTL